MINFVVSLGKPLVQILDEFENFTNKLKLNLDVAFQNTLYLAVVL